MEKRNRPTLLGANTVFMVSALLLITLGYSFQVKDIYSGLIITELLIIPMPALIYVIWKKASITNTFRIRGISLSVLLRSILIALCAYPAGLFINLLVNILLGMLGKLIPTPIPVATNCREYLLNITVFALIAGTAEELFFRGFLLKSFEGLGKNKAVVICAVLFGIFHFNIQNFLGPVFLGLVFGYLAVKADTIIAPAVGHFVNNALSVTLMYVAETASEALPQGYENYDAATILKTGLIFWGLMALIGGVAVFRLLKGIGPRDAEDAVKAVAPSFKDFVPIAVTIIIFIAFCISELVTIIGGAG